MRGGGGYYSRFVGIPIEVSSYCPCLYHVQPHDHLLSASPCCTRLLAKLRLRNGFNG